MPAALSLRTASRMSPQLDGVVEMPALVNSSLLYQKRAIRMSHGTPYSLPLILYGSSEMGVSSLTHDETSAVMSLTSWASTCCLSTPPPQDWKRSGGLPAWVTVVSFCLKAS